MLNGGHLSSEEYFHERPPAACLGACVPSFLLSLQIDWPCPGEASPPLSPRLTCLLVRGYFPCITNFAVNWTYLHTTCFYFPITKTLRFQGALRLHWSLLSFQIYFPSFNTFRSCLYLVPFPLSLVSFEPTWMGLYPSFCWNPLTHAIDALQRCAISSLLRCLHFYWLLIQS